MRDSGLVCASCRAEAEDPEEYEETNLLQSISELQSHIVTRHTDLVTHRSFVLVQNTAAGPQRHTFTYYLCTQCGKCSAPSVAQPVVQSRRRPLLGLLLVESAY